MDPKFRVSVELIVQELRNFWEGISRRSEQGFSSHVDLWHREVWVTLRILCTALNSKTALHDTDLHVSRRDFF